MFLRLATEGFKLTRTQNGYEGLANASEPKSLFTTKNGRACFQLLLGDFARFALSTGTRQWYSENGHMDRYRLAVSAKGCQVALNIEQMHLDDDDCLRADALLHQDTAEYASGEIAAVFAEVRVQDVDAEVEINVYHAFGTHPEERAAHLTLPVRVLPVALPKPTEYALYLDLWQHPSNLARKHETPLWSDAHFAVIDRYAASMAALGQKSISVMAGDVPWRGQRCMDVKRFPADLFEYAMIRTIKKADGTMCYDYSAMDRYIETFERNGIKGDIEVFGLCNIWMKESFDDHKLVADDPEPYISLPCLDEATGALSYLSETEQVDAFLLALQNHFEKIGRLPRVRLAADEPADIPAYRKSIERIRRAAPKIRLKTAINHAEFIDEFKDYIDDFMPSLGSVCAQYDVLAHIREHLTGKRFLWYVCCGPDHPNTFLRSKLCETRLIAYLTYVMKFDGFLRWNYTVWPSDPRKDIRYGDFAAGDTNFVYPSTDGSPVLSLRYKAMQRMTEDFELLTMLKKAGKAELAQEIALSVLNETDVRKFFPDQGEPIPLEAMCKTDDAAYDAARLALLNALAEK